MRNKRAKQIKRDAEMLTVGKSIKETKNLYRRMKRQHTTGIKHVGEEIIDQISSLLKLK